MKKLAKLLLPKYQKLILDYPVEMKPRYGHGKKPHELLNNIIEGNRKDYEKYLSEILAFKNIFQEIKTTDQEKDENKIAWNNEFLPGLDIISLYTFISTFKPKNYIEIGSGNSTKVARKSITENKLDTKIISIDPFPRANIDHLADEVIRMPLEKISDLKTITDRLNENDILFIDNSHRCFPNSDVTVSFLELLPVLKKGVIVHVHDIYLPYDYPQFMCDRFYSEQYLLAAFLLANPEKYKTIFPAYFISEDKSLSSITDEIWSHPNTRDVEKHGGSYWFRIEK
jgi:hypothetical protein